MVRDLFMDEETEMKSGPLSFDKVAFKKSEELDERFKKDAAPEFVESFLVPISLPSGPAALYTARFDIRAPDVPLLHRYARVLFRTLGFLDLEPEVDEAQVHRDENGFWIEMYWQKIL